MIGCHWQNTIILGKGLAYDLNTCLLSPAYAYLDEKIFFLHLKEGVLYPISQEEASNVAYVARFVLLQRAFINPPTFDTWRHHLKFYLFFTPSFVISRQIAAFLQLKWPLGWGFIGTICLMVYSRLGLICLMVYSRLGLICLMVYSRLGLNWRTTAQAREIANTPNDLVKEPLDRKPTCKTIVNKPLLPPSGSFQMLPTELNVKICSLVAKTHDLRPFSSTCQWATQLYHQETDLKPVLHLEGMPPFLLQGVQEKVHNFILNKIKFLQCTSELLIKACNIPTQFPTAPHKAKEHLKEEEEGLKNISKLVSKGASFPSCLPTLQSVLGSRTFFITVNPDWLGNHKFLRTVTAAGTPAFIFVYETNYQFPRSSRRFYQNKNHILILTQPSPLRPKEWGIVLQSWACGEEGVPITLFRGALNSNHYLRLAFDQEGAVIPECQTVWDWLMRFLEGQEVGFFFHDKEDFYPEDPQQRWFMQLKQG